MGKRKFFNHMESNRKLAGVGILVLCVAVAASFVYYFIVRPIQQDKKLDECLDSMWSFYGNQDAVYKEKAELCVMEIKGK